MWLNLYSVHDNAVGAFMTPFFCRTDSEAMRSFRDACTDPKHSFYRHLSDYVLYRLGDYDDSNGTVRGLDIPTRIVEGSALGSESS